METFLPGTTKLFVNLFRNLTSLSVDELKDGFSHQFFGGLPQYPLGTTGTPNIYQDDLHLHKHLPDGRLDSSNPLIKIQNDLMHHYEIPFAAVILYILFITFGPMWMKNRRPFQLSGLLFWWNIFLALFSIGGAAILIQHYWNYLQKAGFTLQKNFCDNEEWFTISLCFIMTFSKFFELFDTVWLILRKRPVIFLHWYHHIATLLMTWEFHFQYIHIGSFFMFMNLIVHSIMYSYYAAMCTSVRSSIPGWLPRCITLLQISQMVGGMYLIFFAFENCPTTYFVSDLRMAIALALGLGMYLSYFILFIQLFLGRSAREASNSSSSTASPQHHKKE